MGRAPCCEKMGLKRGPWTPDEDQILISYIRQHGHPNWRALPKHAGLLRCGKSCRLRWINYLKPDIKRGNFSPQEEDTIINLHQLLGNRWSFIASKLPGRTDNEIKNVWHTRLKKRLPKLDSDSTATYRAITTTTTSEATKESTEKGDRKCKTKRKKKISRKLKLEQENYNDQNDNNNNNNNNNDDSNNTSDTINVGGRHAKLMEEVFHQPCTSEMSTITSTTSTSTSPCDDELNRGMENVGEKGDYFGDYMEINDDFWMEMLSLEDTAISTHDLSCVCQYDQDTSLDTLIVEPIRFDSNSKIDGENGDVDLFWDNFFNKIQ